MASKNKTGVVIGGTRYANPDIAEIIEQVVREFGAVQGTNDPQITSSMLWEAARGLRDGEPLRTAVQRSA